MQRTSVTTILFAIAAVLMTALLAFVAYRGVRNALADEFGRRLVTLAQTAASQVSPEDVREVHLLGEDASAFLAIQVLLEEVRSSTGLVYATALDSAGLVLYDTRGAERHGEPSDLDTLAHATLAAALAGRSGISAAYAPRDGAPGEERRAGLAPIHANDRVAGVIAVESRVDYLPVLADFRRTLLLATLLAALGIAVLTFAVVRTTNASARLERRLSRAENLAAMGRLTATMAHEIKNPLAIIRGSAERLGKLDPESKRWAESVIEETDRLSHTVRRYLQFARGDGAEAGTAAVGDAAQALRETLDLLEGEFRTRRMALDRPSPVPAVLPVRLDNESLKQVFLNLMLNALEALPEGGRLAVAVDERRDAVHVRFADDGPGIPAETLRQLGSPFVTTKAQGSGLGLFLTRRLVQSAGGHLDIESQVGRGTTCTVRLPRLRG